MNGVMRPWVDLDGQAVANGRSCSMDVMLWTASLLLLHYLEHADVDWTGTRLLELSAGTGHLAVGMARLGAARCRLPPSFPFKTHPMPPRARRH